MGDDNLTWGVQIDEHTSVIRRTDEVNNLYIIGLFSSEMNSFTKTFDDKEVAESFFLALLKELNRIKNSV